MPVLTIRRGLTTRTVEFAPGTPLREALAQADCSPAQPCGGRGVCGKCAVQLSGAVSDPNVSEQSAGVRLSCQAVLLGDAEVILPVETAMAIETGRAAAQSVVVGHDVGAAVDIGTTTLVLQLFDMQTGGMLASCAMLNPQTGIAADVIGRISAAMHGQLAYQQKQITEAVNTLLHRAAAQAGVTADSVKRFVVTGNTTMLYLLTGRDPSALSHAPFEADHLFGETIDLLGRPAYLPPCLHAFVGADVACAALTSGMCSRNDTVLLCDIGTNGEIALWKDGVLHVASTAAGPAFEGAGISCGCPSIAGAIDRVISDGYRLHVHTIGDAPAVGVCGSGLIDAIAALLDMEIIDETGAMDDDAILAPGVALTQADIRAVQLSKAAIAAGIECLLDAAHCTEDDIAQVCLAGGFGSRMNLRSAARIGLLPESLTDRVRILGNAAIDGAAILLCNERRAEIDAIARHSAHVPLGGNPRFNDCYMNAMMFE